MLDPKCFQHIDKLWGPHTIDRFASVKTKQLDRYCSQYRNPGCEASNAFTVCWAKENSWIFPPPRPAYTAFCGLVASPYQQGWILEELHKGVYTD